MAQKRHFTLRIGADTLERLTRQAEHRGLPRASLAEQYLEESVRMVEHPGILFRNGPAGRRAGLAGYGLDVWEVVETVQDEGGDVQAAASYLNISPHLVTAALHYYADYPAEIDAWIARNAAEAEEAEAAWRRRQAILHR